MLLGRVVRDLFKRDGPGASPLLSVLVNFYNNTREALNTLYSLSRSYQRESAHIPYEVIALDHGSTRPLSREAVCSFGPEFQYRFIETHSVSPVAAINAACRDAAGDRLIVMVDGAHILTPGILQLTVQAFEQFSAPFVATAMFHLGPKRQNLSVLEGYDQGTEDRLLEESAWRTNGYRLYGVSGAFADDSGGWYGQLFESGCFALRKADFLSLGGFDERFRSRGGGLANLDIFQRALVRTDLQYVVLLGEGTFHQFHGGVATNAPEHAHPWKSFHEEYVGIRNRPYFRVTRVPQFIGEFPPEAQHFERLSRQAGAILWKKYPAMIE